jgi:hypothetical protein
VCHEAATSPCLSPVPGQEALTTGSRPVAPVKPGPPVAEPTACARAVSPLPCPSARGRPEPCAYVACRPSDTQHVHTDRVPRTCFLVARRVVPALDYLGSDPEVAVVLHDGPGRHGQADLRRELQPGDGVRLLGGPERARGQAATHRRHSGPRTGGPCARGAPRADPAPPRQDPHSSRRPRITDGRVRPADRPRRRTLRRGRPGCSRATRSSGRRTRPAPPVAGSRS